MKHFPAQRHHPPLAGVSHSHAPMFRWRVVAAFAAVYAAGFLTALFLFRK